MENRVLIAKQYIKPHVRVRTSEPANRRFNGSSSCGSWLKNKNLAACSEVKE